MAIPVAMYGPDPKMADSIGQNLAPEYEVAVVCLSAADAESQLPSNTTVKAVIVAATVSDSDEKKLAGLLTIPVIKASKFDVIKAGGIGPDPVAIAKVFRKKLAKEGL